MMYPISTAFLDYKNRTAVWFGTMTTEAGTVYTIDPSIIDAGSGVLTSDCNLPFIGGSYSTSLQVQLRLSNVDPRTLKNARIELYVRLSVPVPDSVTWADLTKFHWGDLKSITWGSVSKTIYTDIPMGIFYVTDAKRVLYSIRIDAYDNMLKFNADLPQMDSASRSAFGWLRWVCNACGVELGMTGAQIRELPNGSRSFVYAAVDSNVKTYRDLLAKLAAVLGAIAVIDRTGKLILARAGKSPAAEITRSDRFTSEFEDTQSRYTGIWSQYKAQALQEYYKNVGSLEDTGLVIDLGANPFLQISHNSSRTAAVQTIIDAFADTAFTPYNVTIPFNPAYDLLDVLSFSEGHAPDNCYGPITSITRPFSGRTTLQCAMPEEQVNPTRETMQVDGLSGSGGTCYASSGFWILMDSFPDAETEISGDTVTTELTVNCTVDNTSMQIAWTGTYTLDTDATVTAKVLVDDEVIYQVSDDQKAGNHTLNITAGHIVNVQGERVVKIVLSEVELGLAGDSTLEVWEGGSY